MRFKIEGKLKLKTEKKFSRQIEAINKNMASHKIKSFFGNVYRLKRNRIVIEKIEEMK
jgi:ribosomal protein L20A (L18A)